MIDTARRQLLAAALLGAAGARAQTPPAPVAPPELAAVLPGARLQGSGRLRFMGLRIYDARLWSGATAVGTDWVATPLALELEYARELKGELIAERSLAEMRRQADVAADTAARWLAAMKQAFPDIKSGDRLIGLMLPGQGVRFVFNGRVVGEVLEIAFARLFFGIWLSPRSSEPALRESLLGRARP